MPINAVPIISEMGKTFVDIDILTDGAGNLLLGIVGAGNDNGVDCYKLSTSGVLTYLDTVYPAPGGTVGHKVDKAAIHRSGTNLVVGMITHDAISEDPRSIRVELAQVPNVYVVRAGEELEEGAAGAFQPTGGGEVGGATKEEVQAIVNAAVSAIKGQENITLRVVVDNIGPKTKTGVEQLFDGAQGSHIVYNQLRNTSYSGALDAIRDSDKPQEEVQP